LLDQNKGAHYLMIDFVSEVDYEKMISPIGKLYTTSIDTAFTFSPARELATLFYYTIFFFLEVFSLLPYISKKKNGPIITNDVQYIPPRHIRDGITSLI